MEWVEKEYFLCYLNKNEQNLAFNGAQRRTSRIEENAEKMPFATTITLQRPSLASDLASSTSLLPAHSRGEEGVVQVQRDGPRCPDGDEAHVRTHKGARRARVLVLHGEQHGL